MDVTDSKGPTVTYPLPKITRSPSSVVGHVAYLARVYANRSSGPLSFWYETPQLNEAAYQAVRLESDSKVRLNPDTTYRHQYFMRFQGKAAYKGPFDDGVPLLDYRGDIGRQFNPIAIAQYGLARFNSWCDTRTNEDCAAWLKVASWLDEKLVPNAFGVPVWMHHFDWPYRQLLKAPWYSGLAQGNGLSLLVRAARASGEKRFEAAAHQAFESMRRDVSEGGVLATDDRGRMWIEEYVVDPPSHILNGFIWALWGVYDYARWSGSREASRVFESCISTLQQALPDYDTGWWSLYELPGGARPMLASRYYHELHIVQLRALLRLTGADTFGKVSDRWQRYLESPVNRTRAFVEKASFTLRHY